MKSSARLNLRAGGGRTRKTAPFALLLPAVMAAAACVAAAAEPNTPNGMPGVASVENAVRLRLHMGASQIVHSPWPVARVSITSPDVADVQVLTPRQVLVVGKSIGRTDLTLWGDQEPQVWRAQVVVDADIEELSRTIAEMFPDSKLRLRQSGKVLLLTGRLARAEQARQLQRYFQAQKVDIVDMTSLAGEQQVQLQIRLAEVDRQAIRALGINALFTGEDAFGGSVIGSSGGGPINPISIGPAAGTSAVSSSPPFVFTGEEGVGVSPAVTLFAGFPEAGLELFIQAICENQYMRVLSEPTLVALSGEEASFLAGGEFPIPVVQTTGGGAGTSIGVEYRQFGVSLQFRPVVLGDNTIRLRVAPEVSELSDVGAVQISGFSIPSIQTRRAETTLEMKSGQTFAMAGLVSESTVARSSRVPGLGELPILGALFRSVRHSRRETELVVLVKVALVSPSSARTPPTPGVLYSHPDDWELYCHGRILGRAAPKISPADATWLKARGLSRLRGVGAWDSYDAQGPSPAPAKRAVEPPATASGGEEDKPGT